ncbi:hypothetical protein MIND_00512500 [Mycena indigotica]|uniref:Uncharacterized protein n=1 Tax=Mycena indigotica TaxID=2126181 RepID=A0A8H6SXJ1_9AGAR|nr:uncharacterized protein MIND_00512500 [Mycena indigotica]KAF7307189.1 hypothetical protein MIND_00512500 [Mycena indigotica]
MHTQLPPELYEPIVNAISTVDRKTLLECCLAASVFRRPCQKRLFMHLHISPTPPGHSYAAVAAKLDQFPKLVDYCTNVHVVFPSCDSPEWEAERPIAEGVLRRLANIRMANLLMRFPSSATPNPGNFIIQVTQWLLGVFEAHHQLERLESSSLLLTPTLFAQWLVGAPKAALRYADIFTDQLASPDVLPPVPPRPLTRLLISGSAGPCVLLGRPELQPYLRSVRELVQSLVEIQSQLSACFTMAPIVERFECHFASGALDWKALRLPTHFPRLRHLTLGIHSHDLPPLLPALVQDGVPVLIGLRLELYVRTLLPEQLDKSLNSQSQLWLELDNALATHGTLTTAEWFLSSKFPEEFPAVRTENKTARYAPVAAFSGKLAERLPKAWERGLVVVDGVTIGVAF